MTIDQLVHFIQENPTILKRPIIINEKVMQVGYDDDEITTFVPYVRTLYEMVNEHCGPACPNWNDNCLKK